MSPISGHLGKINMHHTNMHEDLVTCLPVTLDPDTDLSESTIVDRPWNPEPEDLVATVSRVTVQKDVML